MPRHKIYVRRERKCGDAETAKLVREAINAALNAEGADVACEVSVLITDDDGIRAINAEFRNLDKPTDVLSFPMQEFEEGVFEYDPIELSPETGRLPLGDVIISAERVKAQAEEFGHGEMRELQYLTVHSVLHLLGYDHVDDEERKKLMRKREEEIMVNLPGGTM